MKKLIILIFVTLTLNISASELSWVNEQIEAIKPPRKGASRLDIATVKNPFIFTKEKKNKSEKKPSTYSKSARTYKSSSSSKKRLSKKSTPKIKIDAIMNKSVLINGKWYKLNTKFKKYTISKISKDYIILTYKKAKLILSTKSKNSNLKFNK